MQKLRSLGFMVVLLIVLSIMAPASGFALTYLNPSAVAIAPLIVTVDDPANHVVRPPSDFDGVAQITLNFPGVSNVFWASGSLLNAGGKIFVLTAAHVVDYQGLLPASFTAAFPGLGATYTGVRFYVHPNWTGDVKDGYDIALVRLDAPVPTRAYDLLRTEISATVIGDLAGFGYSGTGDTGATLPLGTLHQGQNTIGEFFWPMPGAPYTYDFDNGTALQNSLQSYFGVSSDSGLGSAEATLSFGDSGGSLFIGGLIAGVHSFGATAGLPYDIDSEFNSSFGEFGGDTRVAACAPWIDSVVAAPLPGAIYLLASGLAILALGKRLRSS